MHEPASDADCVRFARRELPAGQDAAAANRTAALAVETRAPQSAKGATRFFNRVTPSRELAQSKDRIVNRSSISNARQGWSDQGSTLADDANS